MEFIIKLEYTPINHESFIGSYLNEAKRLISKLINENDYGLLVFVDEFLMVIRIYPKNLIEMFREQRFKDVLKFNKKNMHLVISQNIIAEDCANLDEKKMIEILNEKILFCLNRIPEKKDLQQIKIEELNQDVKYALKKITVKQIKLNNLNGK